MPLRKTTTSYNCFTKSYTSHYTVHAGRLDDNDKTVCGRDVFMMSKIIFESDGDHACKSCIKRFEVERRYHPGWDGKKVKAKAS